jgi:hypothetical protein
MASSLDVRHIYQIRSFSIFVVGFMLNFFLLFRNWYKETQNPSLQSKSFESVVKKYSARRPKANNST